METTRSKKRETICPSRKIFSRFYALYLFFSSFLPDEKPSFIESNEWDLLIKLKNYENLVILKSFQDDKIIVAFPASFDLMVHSYVVYGEDLVNYSKNKSSLFRWWSDSEIPCMNPISSVGITRNLRNRTIVLPHAIVANAYLRKLFRDNQFPQILRELASFFRLLCQYNSDDYGTRKDIENLVINCIICKIQEWNLKLI